MAEKVATTIIVETLLDDSDEESTEDDMPFILMISSLLQGFEKSRIRGYTEDVVPFYTLDSFRRMFRMDKETYKILLAYMEGCPSLHPSGHGRREPISINQQLLVTLWYVGGTDSITKIADRFGMSESSVISCRNNILSELIAMTDKFIRWPSLQEMIDESQEFERRNGFPDIVGAIGGTHIEIKAPTSHPQSYVNRKGYHSIQLRCVCRCNMAFSHVFTGYPGSVHDARVLKNSDLWEDGLTKCNMMYHILGDAAYPLRKWLLTPFRDNGHLDPQEKRYNHLHSSNRVIIERVFAVLKSRFRRLKYIDTQKVKTAVKIIMACCILHNICIFNNDNIEEYLIVDNENNQPNIQIIHERDAERILKRNIIARNLR